MYARCRHRGEQTRCHARVGMKSAPQTGQGVSAALACVVTHFRDGLIASTSTSGLHRLGLLAALGQVVVQGGHLARLPVQADLLQHPAEAVRELLALHDDGEPAVVSWRRM